MFGSVHLLSQCSLDLLSFELVWFASLQVLHCYSQDSCKFCNGEALDLSKCCAGMVCTFATFALLYLRQ